MDNVLIFKTIHILVKICCNSFCVRIAKQKSQEKEPDFAGSGSAVKYVYIFENNLPLTVAVGLVYSECSLQHAARE